MEVIYLDHNATTPLDPEVAEVMRPFLSGLFGNPSSTHRYGIEARKAVEHARKQVADLLGGAPDEIVFTSGGSESNNHAIRGAVLARRRSGNHIITSAIEHPAVLETCNDLEREGFIVTRLPVDSGGLLRVDDVIRAITPATILITVMHANNEVGTIEPIAEIAAVAREHGVLFHTDAAQTPGKIPVNIVDLGVDLLSLAGHKLYGPKGVGALFVRRGVVIEKLIHGAAHELNRRAGTENVMEIAGLGKACEIAVRDLEAVSRRMRSMRDRLMEKLTHLRYDLRFNGHPERCLPNTLSVSFAGIEATTLLSELDGIAASPGAACHAESVSISHVLEALNVPPEYSRGTVRFSTGRRTTEAEIDRAAEMLEDALSRLRPIGGRTPIAVTDGAPVRLTRFTHGLGCACKMRPQLLQRILSELPVPEHADIIVGPETFDDAAVYRIDDRTAIVHTVDFFTPVVDDPYWFGAIAAANALSDIYAMGGTPLFALNIVAFPSQRLQEEVLRCILRGAYDKAREAGILILGGHTIENTEPIFGMAVVGRISPDHVLTNRAAQAGDAIVLTKPIGTGIISTAIKRDMADPETTAQAMTMMSSLNRTAAEVMRGFKVHACTDVTGFGLLGHLLEMTRGCGLNAVIESSAVPLIEKAIDLAGAGILPGGTMNNLEFIAPWTDWGAAVPDVLRSVLADAQTSGGLLIAVHPDDALPLVEALRTAGIGAAAHIGHFCVKGEGRILVQP